LPDSRLLTNGEDLVPGITDGLSKTQARDQRFIGTPLGAASYLA
jgi:hypothetical protein